MSEEVEYKFYVKASPDGRHLGDCPFTHRANLAFKLKGVTKVTMILIDLSNKPEWYKKINTSVPAIEFGDRVIGDSYEIVKYLDETFPDPPLEPPNNKEAEEVTGQIFGIFSNWAKNSQGEGSQEAEDKFTAELKKIDDYIGQHPYALLCSDQWSIADCVLVPRLYHMITVATNYLGYTKYESMRNLAAYMNTAFSSDAFKATDYPVEYILAGWAKYFKPSE